MTYSPTKFEVATSNGLGGDTFTRNVTDGRTQGRTDGRWTDFDTKLILFFSKEKSGYKNRDHGYRLNYLFLHEQAGPQIIMFGKGPRIQRTFKLIAKPLPRIRFTHY